jgi:DNA-binding MarR family transcriptional regulator
MSHDRKEPEMNQPQFLTGQDIGLAERATRALQDRVLAEIGTPLEQWVALRLVVTSGGWVRVEQVVAQMVNGLNMAEADAYATVAALEARGDALADQETRDVKLTDTGRARFECISAAVQRITTALYGDLPAEDLAAARRVLVTVTERAKTELMARSASAL